MKDIKECIDSSFATPMNTIGMGNVSDTSGDALCLIPKDKKLKKKKMKPIKKYISEKLVLNKDTFKRPEIKNHPETAQDLKDIIVHKIRNNNNSETLDLNDIDVSEITDMRLLFNVPKIRAALHDYNIKKIDINYWNTKNVTNMSYMFYQCFTIEEINISNINVESLDNADGMFNDCKKLKHLDLSSWNTDKLRRSSAMFKTCVNLVDIGDLSGWNMTNIEDCCEMFANCLSLVKIGDILGKWKLPKAENINRMFYLCENLTDIGNTQVLFDWKLNPGCQKSLLFYGCRSLKKKPVMK